MTALRTNPSDAVAAKLAYAFQPILSTTRLWRKVFWILARLPNYSTPLIGYFLGLSLLEGSLSSLMLDARKLSFASGKSNGLA